MKEFTKEDIKHFVQFGTGGSFTFLNALLEDLTVYQLPESNLMFLFYADVTNKLKEKFETNGFKLIPFYEVTEERKELLKLNSYSFTKNKEGEHNFSVDLSGYLIARQYVSEGVLCSEDLSFSFPNLESIDIKKEYLKNELKIFQSYAFPYCPKPVFKSVNNSLKQVKRPEMESLELIQSKINNCSYPRCNADCHKCKELVEKKKYIEYIEHLEFLLEELK